MKFFTNAFAALLLAVVFVACKKDKETIPVPSFELAGKWEGKIGNGSAIPTGAIILNFKANGTVERLNSNGAATATGPWELNGNKLEAEYIYTSDNTNVTIEATVDKFLNKISGNWENSHGAKGTFYVKK